MNNGDKDVFDFLNQLGTGAREEQKTLDSTKLIQSPAPAAVPTLTPAKAPAPPKDEWDAVFNIGGGSASKKTDDFDFMSDFSKPKPTAAAKIKPLVATPIKAPANDLGGLNLLEGIQLQSVSSAGSSGLGDLDWGSTFAKPPPANIQPAAGKIANLAEDPFAELEGPEERPEGKAAAVPGRVPVAANSKAATRPPQFQQKSQPKQQPPQQQEDIDDFFSELSKTHKK